MVRRWTPRSSASTLLNLLLRAWSAVLGLELTPLSPLTSTISVSESDSGSDTRLLVLTLLTLLTAHCREPPEPESEAG